MILEGEYYVYQKKRESILDSNSAGLSHRRWTIVANSTGNEVFEGTLSECKEALEIQHMGVEIFG